MPVRDATAVVRDWHAVRRDRETVDDATSEAEALEVKGGRLRDEYERLVEEAWIRNQPALPPFPDR